MSLITDAAIAWSDPIVLISAEIWQARKEGAFLTTSASPAADDGLFLREGAAVHLSAGQTVRYRAASARPALIVREAV